ncbi:MAG: NAD(P)-dependent alcohol dehydrogenase [Magnetospirillum sp.]|nr:NAD(P)-dependent alcohol dehydrogenase [Magnetospirillum sp.]
MIKAHGYAAANPTAPLAPFTFERRDPGPHDIQMEILYCGVCHSDLHQIHDDWGGSIYPMVPGHEIIGRVVAVGTHVKTFKVGDIAGVGCMVDSCQHCDPCQHGLEQYCEEGATWTYNGRERDTGAPTHGGYSDVLVVKESFAVKVPPSLDLKAAAPLLCAGITTYSPLKHWQVGPGMTVGVVGLGGLGHMGVKFAHAMGARVVMITTSAAKGADATKIGADEVLVSTDPEAMARYKGKLDFILNTVPVGHDANPYMSLLKLDGTMVVVGLLTGLEPPLNGASLIFGRKSIAGSGIGGIAETQEMFDFCAEHGITCEVEVIPIQSINQAYERLVRNDVRYRFVIDMASLKAG